MSTRPVDALHGFEIHLESDPPLSQATFITLLVVSFWAAALLWVYPPVIDFLLNGGCDLGGGPPRLPLVRTPVQVVLPYLPTSMVLFVWGCSIQAAHWTSIWIRGSGRSISVTMDGGLWTTRRVLDVAEIETVALSPSGLSLRVEDAWLHLPATRRGPQECAKLQEVLSAWVAVERDHEPPEAPPEALTALLAANARTSPRSAD